MLGLRNVAAEEAIRRIWRDRKRTRGMVRRMLAYLEKHLFDPNLQVRTVKAALGIHDNTVALRFHSEVGSSPKVYITNRRMEVARRLLKDTHLPVWRIGELVGFSSLGTFSQRFDGVVGIRPSVYRRRARRGAKSPHFSDRELEKAVAGKLPAADAAQLIESLGAMYPGVLASALKRKDEDPARSGEEVIRWAKRSRGRPRRRSR
jgi:AraC-like DNA-binding protein